MSDYKTVLVAIDIHAQYKQVIDKALSIRDNPSQLHLIYVPLPVTYINPYLYGIDYNEIDDANRLTKSHEELKDIAKQFSIPDSNVHFKAGDAADEIHDIATQIDADLIVIGTHGRSGIKRLLGSTANSVLHGVKRDVLAVRVTDE